MYDNVSEQEPAWPQPKREQMVQLLEESCQQVRNLPSKRAGRPAKVSWSHLCLAILLCFLRGWNTQLEVWRLIGSQRLGGFAPVQVCDQAIYNRLERAGTWLYWLFEQVSAWLRTRLEGWEDRRLAPWASQVYAVDASTLDRLGRFLPWLRPVAEGDKAGLGARSARCWMCAGNNGCGCSSGRMPRPIARSMSCPCSKRSRPGPCCSLIGGI